MTIGQSDRTSMIRSQLSHVLRETKLEALLGPRESGKVRDSYQRGDTRLLIATDRLSCFDRVLTTIPFKGEVLTQLAAFWLEKAAAVVPTHVISVPDPNVMVVWQCDVLPVEVVVRGYLAGSGYRSYLKGEPVSGVRLPPGLREFDPLPAPVLTPSTKEKDGGHDLPISEREIVDRGLVPEGLWRQVAESALALFRMGSEWAAAQGLILADTKYEFGVRDGKLLLVDELHTLDSSRFWVRESYAQRLADGGAPEMLDKEPMRRWLIERGFMGEGQIPEINDEQRIAVAAHYIRSAERLMGRSLLLHPGDTHTRIARNVERSAALAGTN